MNIMPSINKPSGSGGSQNNSGKNSNAVGWMILIVIILIFFFWHFIDYRTANWTGNAKEDSSSAIIRPEPDFNFVPVPKAVTDPLSGIIADRFYPARTVTEYDAEYLRWVGEVAPGQYATWGKITMESSEVPVDDLGPRSPATVYGNIREAAGVGINFMIFDEENYEAWRNGGKDTRFIHIGKDLSDYNYTLDISHGSYYIVAENTSAADTFIGFTGVLAYSRTLGAAETPLNQGQRFAYFWDIKTEKLTLWEYILKLFRPAYNVSVTPPAISGK